VEQIDAQMKYVCALKLRFWRAGLCALISSTVSSQSGMNCRKPICKWAMHVNGQGRAKDMQSGISLLEKSFKLGGDEAAYQQGKFSR
jgi:hypothetical protein